MRLRLALFVAAVSVVFAVSGAGAADFEGDTGPCRETPGEPQLLRCPNAVLGQEYEIEIESEEGSGCSPDHDYFVLVGTLPPGLTLSRDGVISGVPRSAGLARFWIHNHDLDVSQGGPSWCIRDDTSEREFSIYVDPSLEIETATLKAATVGQGYSETFTAKRIVTLDPRTGSEAAAKWSLKGGSLPPGLALSEQGLLTGTPSSQGSYHFIVTAENGNASAVKEYTLSVRELVRVTSPLGPALPARSEVGLRLEKTFTASGGSGTYTWALASGALPAGVVLDPTRGTIAGTPRAAGVFPFEVTATDSEGRAATSAAALAVAPRLTIKTARLKAAKVGRIYRMKLATVGGIQPVRWSLLRGRLPRGLTLSRRTGAITGVARQRGRFLVTFAARDGLRVTSRRTLRLIVSS